jgi:hypothetical protein
VPLSMRPPSHIRAVSGLLQSYASGIRCKT